MPVGSRKPPAAAVTATRVGTSRAKNPGWSNERLILVIPLVSTRPKLGLNPKTPQ